MKPIDALCSSLRFVIASMEAKEADEGIAQVGEIEIRINLTNSHGKTFDWKYKTHIDNNMNAEGLLKI